MRNIDYNNRLKEIAELIGENLAKARGGMKKTDLQKKSGVHPNTIRAIEKGKSFNFQTIVKLADALGISLSDLFISDSERKDVSYKHILLINQLVESAKQELREFMNSEKKEFRKFLKEEIEKALKKK